MSLSSHTIPPGSIVASATETLINHKYIVQEMKWEMSVARNNLHLWFWPLRKEFRLWWRTFDLTNCTRTLYHHLDSSWHVPFTNVEQSGVWMRIELVCPVICSASATSMTSDINMLACGIVSGYWKLKKEKEGWLHEIPDPVEENTHAFIHGVSEFTIVKQNEPASLPPLEANQNLIKISFILALWAFNLFQWRLTVHASADHLALSNDLLFFTGRIEKFVTARLEVGEWRVRS